MFVNCITCIIFTEDIQLKVNLPGYFPESTQKKSCCRLFSYVPKAYAWNNYFTHLTGASSGVPFVYFTLEISQ